MCCGRDLWPFSLFLVLSAGMLSGRSAARCPCLSSRASLLCGALFFSCYCRRCCGFWSLPPPTSLPRGGCCFPPWSSSVTVSETLYTAYKVPFMLCSMLKWCVHHQRLTVCVDCTGTKRKLEENNEDESLRQLEEGIKDAWMNVWWTAVKWLSKLCLCRVALFPLSVGVFNELLISFLYILIWDLTHWGLNIKLMALYLKMFSYRKPWNEFKNLLVRRKIQTHTRNFLYTRGKQKSDVAVW